MFRNIFFFILLFSVKNSIGQSTLSISVESDTVKHQVIRFCNITITHLTSNEIVNKCVTDSVGFCNLIIQYKGVYTLTARKPGFLEKSINIEIKESKPNIKNITLVMLADTLTLPDVVVTSNLPPIVIHGDTISYNTNHFAMPSDDNLEDVLKRIPDFQVLQNGDVKVKGMLVNKVLVNGKDITNLGTAILTRSFSPEMVNNIELRKKDSAFKESLLSQKDVLVLDIKLKKNINLPFFGRLKYSSGIQNKILNGGYSNLFSLNKKLNFHLLAEYDQFGSISINRGQLKNIDKESYESVFYVPANINTFKNSDEYNNEIYGFKDYSVSQPGIIALTSRFEFKKNIILTIGSYNTFKKRSVELINTQTFFSNNINNQYYENTTSSNFFTKNKFELKIPIKNKSKLELTFLFNNLNQNDGQYNTSGIEQKYYDFEVTRKEKYFTNNILFEKIMNSKVSFKFVGQYSNISNSGIINLLHNDSLYSNYLYNEQNQLVNKFNQQNISDYKQLNSKYYLQYEISNSQKVSIGLQYSYRNIVYSKKAFSLDKNVYNFLPSSPFTSFNNNGKSRSISPYIQYIVSKGKFLIDISNGLVFVKSIINKNSIFNDLKFEYNANVKYKQSDYDVVEFSWKRNVSPIVLSKQMPGLEVLSFQTIGFPNIQTANPQYENTLNLNFYTSLLASAGISCDFSLLYGDTKYTDKINGLNSTFIGYEYNQLDANYFLLSTYFNKTYGNLPLYSKLEIDVLNSNQFNVSENGSFYNTNSIMQKYFFSVFTMFDKKRFDFKLNLGYQKFILSSDVSTDKSYQNNWIGEFVTNYSFDNKRGVIKLNIKNTVLYGISKSNYTNINFKSQYKYKGVNVFIEIDNLLNNQYFIKREILPLFQFDNQIKTFDRYIKIGVEKKIF
jgi:hypothetical protein